VDLDQYQTKLRSLTQSIQVEGDLFEFNCIGLAEEAGEVMSKLKRALRGEGFDRNGYLLELGDVLGYLALAAGAKEIQMSTIFHLVTRQSPILEDNWLHIIAASKALYSAVGELLDESRTDDKMRMTWYLASIFRELCYCICAVESGLTEIMRLNLQKLHDRLERNGTLFGTGDYR
jgi:NTP pyrophosphatase (non-canonical NTP hydrolase)